MPFEQVLHSVPRSDVVQFHLARFFAQDVVEREGGMSLQRGGAGHGMPGQNCRVDIDSHFDRRCGVDKCRAKPWRNRKIWRMTRLDTQHCEA